MATSSDKPRPTSSDKSTRTSLDKPTPADEEAMMEIANWARSGTATKFPSKLKKYLETHNFIVHPPPISDTFPIHPYEVSFCQKIEIKALPAGTAIPAGESLKFDAYVVRMIPRDANFHAIKTFPQGGFVTVDVSRPQSARVVVTVQLQGCSFVIGQDANDKNILHLGHAQPTTGGGVSHSKELLQQFTKAPKNSVFEDKQLKKVQVFGGYDSDIVKLLGWITGGKLFLVVKGKDHFAVHTYP